MCSVSIWRTSSTALSCNWVVSRCSGTWRYREEALAIARGPGPAERAGLAPRLGAPGLGLRQFAGRLLGAGGGGVRAGAGGQQFALATAGRRAGPPRALASLPRPLLPWHVLQ